MVSLPKLHGLMLATSFLLLFPLGAAIAMFRHHLGSWWFIAHIAVQSVATILVLVAGIIIVVYRYKKSKTQKEDRPSIVKQTHRMLGTVLITLLVLQWVWAIMLRNKFDWSVWYNVHITLAALIICIGFIQVYLGSKI